MNEAIFISLFKEACEKCFGNPLTHPLTETDSKILANKINEKTGLVIGPRSIKNYSFYVLSPSEYSKENPSDATLDTLARYVLDAPHTNEVHRKANENHFPYWFRYRKKFSGEGVTTVLNHAKAKSKPFLWIITMVLLVLVSAVVFLSKKEPSEGYSDNFNSLSEDTLAKNGWILKSVDSAWWNKRGEKQGHLALFTLKGDNWKNAENPAHVSNLIMRKIKSECFTVEIHLTGFIPRYNWQQAGILLSEDSTFDGKMVRLSISYNNFFGGYEKPPEIIIQAVKSEKRSKPEEIAHFILFNLEPGKINLVEKNLTISALKIEKSGANLRFLYTAGPVESFAFKEIASGEISIDPAFVGLFAIQGWSENGHVAPAYFDSFIFSSIPCVK